MKIFETKYSSRKLIIGIIISTCIVFIFTILFKKVFNCDFMFSISSNIFTGLLTGLVLYIASNIFTKYRKEF
jgi:undecaprenyl pyrophosphate phosphatase UppP